MNVGYLRWLAELEVPHGAGDGPSALLDVEVFPAGCRLPALTGALGHLVARLAPPGSAGCRAAIVVAAATGPAAQVYTGDDDAITALISEVLALTQKAADAGGVVLVQTLPYGPEQSAAAVERANTALGQALPEGVLLVGVHRLASLDVLVAAENFAAVADALTALGRHHRVTYLWNLIVDVAWAHWQLLAPQFVSTPKAVLADLDGVLWPGTVAEDGADGALGAAGPVGLLAYQLWRDHLRGLQERGVLLAAVSKNDAAEARQALELVQPPLHLAGLWAAPDIDKAAAASAVLEFFDGIDPGHALAVDDTAAQQELLRRTYPGMWVPAVVAAPLLLQDLLRQLPQGPAGPVTNSDLQRTAFYAARSTGELIPEVVCIVDPDDPDTLDRLAQLHAKTNQFNMTTPRHTLEQLAAASADRGRSLLAFRVVYHGADLESEINGCAEIRYRADGQAELTSFVSSCRLLWAGTQRRMFDEARAVARHRGAQTLTAWWKPNGRNDSYSLWYAHQGWAEPQQHEDGWSFTGPTATRDGETAEDLLGIMGRYLDSKPAGPDLGPARVRLRAVDGAEEVWVPGGPVTTGLPVEDVAVVRSVFGLDPIGEEPRQHVLEPLWIDRRLVSRDQFAAFLTSIDPADLAAALQAVPDSFEVGPMQNVSAVYGTGALPAVVPWRWACRYATWAGGRLPSEAEWEAVARGHDGRWFPWGAELPGPRRCHARGSGLHSIDTSTGGASPYGVYDMVGHVWQWCSDTYRGHPQYRGGDVNANTYFLRATVRPLENAEHCGHQVGFRVVRDVTPAASER